MGESRASQEAAGRSLGVTVSHIIRCLRRFGQDERGITALEYTLITVILGTVVLAGVDVIGSGLGSALGSISAALSTQVSGI